MASGLLTGTFTAERAARLDPGDWRRGHPDFTATALPANLALAAALRPVVARHGVTPAAVAVAWTLSFPGVTGAIVGARRPGQVDGWLPAASLELKEDDLADIAAAVHATGAGGGPASPAAPGRHRSHRMTATQSPDGGSTATQPAAGPATPAIAFLGTGRMGGPMAANLARAGFRVRAWNRTASRAAALAEDGAAVVGRPADAVRGAGILITMLADGPATEAVLTGPEGLLAAADLAAIYTAT